MAQRIVTECDQHLADGEHVAGVAYTVTISGPQLPARAYETDLCPDHAAMLSDLAAWLADNARPVSNGASPHTCEICGKTLAHATSLRAHLRSQHGVTTTALAGGEDVKCEECGGRFATKQGLATHKARTHNAKKKAPTRKKAG